MTETTPSEPRCDFRADVIVRRGKGWRAVKDVQCIGAADHPQSEWPAEREHSFYAEETLTFGARLEKGRWVSR